MNIVSVLWGAYPIILVFLVVLWYIRPRGPKSLIPIIRGLAAFALILLALALNRDYFTAGIGLIALYLSARRAADGT